MAESQSDTRNITIPRKAVFKTKGTTSGVVEKKELIPYPATALSQNVVVGEHDTSKKIEFLLSGDCMMDGRESFVSLQFTTNKWTSYLSSDISSIVRRLVISLPSNQNTVLEDIDQYAQLQSMLHMVNGGEDSFQANWYSGLNALSNFNRAESGKSSRRFLNFTDEEGGMRTFCFALNLSGILTNETYIPLLLLNGLKITLYLNSASSILHYDPANEQSWDTVFDAIEMPLAKRYATLDANERNALTAGVVGFTRKAAPSAANAAVPLTYTVSAPAFNAMTVWFSTGYVDSLIRASESANGVLLNYDTFRFNQIVPESATVNYAFTDGLQNLKTVFMACAFRTKEQNAHFNYSMNGLKSFCFRVGSRIYHTVQNTQPALSLVSTLLSVGKFGRYYDNSLISTAYSRSKNIHVYNFENARTESATSHSGINTTNGRNLRCELAFHSANGESIVSPTDNTQLVVLTHATPFREIHLNTFLEFSKSIRVNNQGILVSE